MLESALDGHSDWRLPAVDELKRLYDPDATATFVYDASTYTYHIRSGVILTGWIWSGTKSNTHEAWGIDFRDGTRFTYHISPRAGTRALCVRGSSDPQRLAAQPMQTWTDPATGLTWMRWDNGSDMSWQQASSYCALFGGGTPSYWRLPTTDELRSLYDPGAKATFPYDNDAIEYSIKGGIKLTGWPWSSTKNGPDAAWDYELHQIPLKLSFPVAGTRLNKRALCVHGPHQAGDK